MLTGRLNIPDRLAPEPPAGAFTSIGKGDCCRTNDAMIYKSFNDYAETPARCEAECLSTVACRFFSHSRAFGICVYCSACSITSNGMGRGYTSWERKAPPALPNATSAEPLLITMLNNGVPAFLATQRFPLAAQETPPWVHRVVNLATPGTQKMGAVFTKFRLMASWLRNHPEVEDERVVVFVDALDSVWGGCDDFLQRYLRLERATGARLIMSAEMHCGGSTPSPPGCSGTPDPPPWVAGPMTPRRAKEWNTCLPPGTLETKSRRGAQCSWPPSYKFLNSGLYAGRAGEVRAMLDAVLALPRHLILNGNGAEDDQPAVIRIWNSGNHSIALDYGASLFWSLSGIQGGTLRYHRRPGGAPPLIRPAWSDEAACFVHAAGSCHLPQEMVRSHQLLDNLCSLRRDLLVNTKYWHPPEFMMEAINRSGARGWGGRACNAAARRICQGRSKNGPCRDCNATARELRYGSVDRKG